MAPLPTFANLLEHDHGLDAWRPTCQRWARVNLQVLVAAGQGEQIFMQRLKRVFKLDLSSCEGCVGQVRVIASVEDPLVMGKILAHLATPPPALTGAGRRPAVRSPPPGTLALG